METETRIEDSPFYVESKYKTKDEVLHIRMEIDRMKALKKHFKDKHNGDTNLKDVKFNFSDYIYPLINNYLQEQCLERKIFNKSIFALINIEDVTKGYKDSIIPLFVTSPSEYYTTKKHVGGIAYIYAPRDSIDDFKDDKLMELNKELQKIFKDKLKQHQESTHVLEVSLNNYLDFYHNGIYSDVFDESIHHGVNLIGTNIGALGVIYQWKVNDDYSIDPLYIGVCEPQEVLDYLSNSKNDKMHDEYKYLIENHKKNASMNEIDILKNKCDKIENAIVKSNENIQREEQRKLNKQKELKEVQEQIKQLSNH